MDNKIASFVGLILVIFITLYILRNFVKQFSFFLKAHKRVSRKALVLISTTTSLSALLLVLWGLCLYAFLTGMPRAQPTTIGIIAHLTFDMFTWSIYLALGYFLVKRTIKGIRSRQSAKEIIKTVAWPFIILIIAIMASLETSFGLNTLPF